MTCVSYHRLNSAAREQSMNGAAATSTTQLTVTALVNVEDQYDQQWG